MVLYTMGTARIASLPPWTRSKAIGKALLCCLMYDTFVGLDHKLACIRTSVGEDGFKNYIASTTVFELGIVITIFELRCMLRYLWAYVTCGLYAESCRILVVCWIIRDLSWYSTDFRVYTGSSMTVRSFLWLTLYLYSYKLIGLDNRCPSTDRKSATGGDGEHRWTS